MLLRRVLVGAALLALLSWLALRPPPQDARETELVERNLPVLGTWVTLSAYAEDPALQTRVQRAFDQAAQQLADFDTRWRAFGDGTLGRLNAELVAGGSIRVPQDMLPLFRRAFEIQRISGGLFDPRIGALVRVWGFDDEAHYRESPPPQAEIDAALAALREAPDSLQSCPGSGEAEQDCYGPAPGIVLDFGAIAKGYAVDQVGERLLAAGIENFMINAGGNVRTQGRRGDRAWRIAVRHPRPEIGRLLAIVEPDDENVVTSGDYERYFEYQGRRYHHILDPRDGRPAQGLQAVSVLSADGTLADAASTALFVAGPEHWRDTARKLGVGQSLIVKADGALQATQTLAARITLPGKPPLEVVP
ncbi:MAG: FAD:protein FMN transferase [Pseudomonadota bacterium]|nr:FAD:protein FMN transferase [Pseudomonadota bacterium]